MTNLNRIFIGLLTAMAAMPVSAAWHEPYAGSRIYWDLSSKKEIFSSGNYARIIELQDGRLLAVAEGGGINIAWSSNKGTTWSAPEKIVTNGNMLPNAVPDVVQLADGTIVVGYNPRPSTPYSEDRHFGIRAVRSTDNGKTWSNPIFIYDASHNGADGCWEPCFLQLPSGELQCYFANEFPFQRSNEQEISMCRSFDGGQTWGEAQRICYRAGSRDGMPVPILTDNNEIVVIVEDNGWPGRNLFRATTVRCPLEENWSQWVNASSDRRNMIFAKEEDKTYVSAAPYLRKLNGGETIASWQGDRGERNGKGENYYEMCVAVGDADARNFRAVTAPFGLDVNSHGLWNSVSVLSDNTVLAVSSIGSPSKGNAINVMTGKAMRGFEAAWGIPKAIDASLSGDSYTTSKANQINLGGNVTHLRSSMDFSYDSEALYFYAMVTDRDIFTDKIDNDGVFLYLDLENACDTYPQKGMYRIFFNVDGSVEFSAGDGGKWQTAVKNPEGITAAKNVSRSYYIIEAAIPWKNLGLDKAPKADALMRCNIEVRDRRDGKLVMETIPESYSRQSWTWPEFRLGKAPESSVGNVAADVPEVKVSVADGCVSVASDRELRSLNIVGTAGAVLASAPCRGREASVCTDGIKGLCLLLVRFADGSSKTVKILI